MEEYKYLIPEESSDAIITNVAVLREIENNLRSIFSNHHYNEVILPSFEYVDLYTKLDCGFEQDKMFQYINHVGKNVAMRLDFTIPLARLYANNPTSEARYCYFGNVYRKELIHKGRSSEFFQGGIELINVPEIKGDLECLKIIQESLPKLQLRNVIIELGSAKFFNRLLELVGHKEEFTRVLKFRDISGMQKFIQDNNFNQGLNELLLKLPTCFGDIKLLDLAIQDLNDNILIESLKRLRELYDLVENKENIIFDLGMVPTMKYYTGLMIKGYSDKCAYPIISGGRYDNLLPRFNCKASAIGFCFHMNYILKAIEKEGELND